MRIGLCFPGCRRYTAGRRPARFECTWPASVGVLGGPNFDVRFEKLIRRVDLRVVRYQIFIHKQHYIGEGKAIKP